MNDLYNKTDFFVHKFNIYKNSNEYLDTQVLVFNMYLDPDGPNSSYYKEKVLEIFPELYDNYPDKVVNLFALLCTSISKVSLKTNAGKFKIDYYENEYLIALEYLDARLTREIVILVSNWLIALNIKDDSFDFEAKILDIKKRYKKILL